MKHSFLIGIATMALAAATLLPPVPAQESVVGDWLGTWSISGAELHFALHIREGKDGALIASFDSIDQHATGIPVTTIAMSGQTLKFAITPNRISYVGTLNKTGNKIEGFMTQGGPFPLNFKRAPAAAAPTKTAVASPLAGEWLGSLDTGAIKLRIVFKIGNDANGLTAQMQSPDQNPAWLGATSIKQDGANLSILLTSLGVDFEGKVAADLNSIDGTFTQMGNAMPLALKRVKDEAELELKRPQNPVKPYPYREEDVSYANQAGGDTLAATLTIPQGKGPFPAVLLIAGSGPHDRDESLLGHKPFLVLADYLTRKGIVVLRADKRGIGASTGNYATATTADFATDAEAGVAYLKTRAEVDAHRIGLIGHSEGGIIAPMAAVADPDVTFVVMMAGSGVPGDQIIVEQGRLISIAGGESADKAAEDAEKSRETLTLVETEKDPATLTKLLGAKLAAEGVPDAAIAGQIKAMTSPWFRYFLTYDPATAMRQLKIPVLALNGSLDLQVPPAQNLPAIRKALADAGNTHYEVDELPGLNHLFQDAKTGAPSEYGQIEETISPMVLDKLANWILKQ